MRSLKIIWILLTLTLALPLTAQQVPAELVKAFKDGDARVLSDYFHKSLEMTILEKDYVVSKEQASRIMEEFFKNNKPVDFVISFGGEKDDSHYSIGSLKTKDKSFRVNLFFIESADNRRLIYFMSIEAD